MRRPRRRRCGWTACPSREHGDFIERFNEGSLPMDTTARTSTDRGRHHRGFFNPNRERLGRPACSGSGHKTRPFPVMEPTRQARFRHHRRPPGQGDRRRPQRECRRDVHGRARYRASTRPHAPGGHVYGERAGWRGSLSHAAADGPPRPLRILADVEVRSGGDVEVSLTAGDSVVRRTLHRRDVERTESGPATRRRSGCACRHHARAARRDRCAVATLAMRDRRPGVRDPAEFSPQPGSLAACDAA